MIYLFCNEGYGEAFLKAAQQYSLNNGTCITIIFSGKRDYPNSLGEKSLSYMKFHAKWLIKDKLKEMRLSYQLGVRLGVVKDINLSSFFNHIQPDDHGIIAGFNQIFKARTISRFKTLVNFHPSVLPLYRGPVPSYWCIKNNEIKSGYTLHKVTEQIDAGEILFQEEVLISNITDPSMLDKAIAQKATSCFVKYLKYLETENNWIKVKLDATSTYKKILDYASFPD